VSVSAHEAEFRIAQVKAKLVVSNDCQLIKLFSWAQPQFSSWGDHIDYGDENFRRVSQNIDDTIKNIDNTVKISRNIDITVKIRK
jgi:hypothetical protein